MKIKGGLNLKIQFESFYSQYLTVIFMEPKNEDSIQVYIRVKPDQEDDSLVAFSDNQIRVDKNRFAFDKIFPPTATQQDIFQAVGTKVLTHTLDGYNGCIFVYGQTGSGKTHTMVGQNEGLMQRSFSQLFNRIYTLPNSESTITCSYFQIYNQQINDLLDNKKEKKLNIRQDTKRGVFVENLNEELSHGPAKLMECLAMGMKNRRVGETLMNRQSSRSHSIFTISISLKIQIEGKKVLKTPKLHFVDLAGSERQKMTAASGDRLKEAGNINKSLTTLGMVINALTCEKQRNHIPYRDSKLTNLLRDSLGGNSKTFIIATVSCSVLCFQQTLSTLNFANRAKMVKVKAEINEESLSNNIESFKDEIRRLKTEILRLKNQKNTPTIETKEVSKPNEAYISNPRNFDEQFQEINNKVSFIQEHVVKATMSPTLESIINQMEKRKLKKLQTKSTMEQTEEERPQKLEDEDQDIFLEYLNNHTELLHSIHSKIDEYIEIKEQLRNVAYREQLRIAELKTPSKFEREQYEERLARKEEELAKLYGQIKKLDGELIEKSIRIKELSTLNANDIQEKQIEMATIRNSLLPLESQILRMQEMLTQKTNQKDLLQKHYEEIKKQCAQNKDLYLFSEDKFKTENQMRQKLELSLKIKTSQISRLEIEFEKKMEEAIQKYEEEEEQLAQQIDVLQKSVEFNQNRCSEYQQKFFEEKQKSQHTFKKLQESKNLLVQSEADLKEKQQLLRNLSKQYHNYIHTATNQYDRIKDQLEKNIDNYHKMCQKYEGLERVKEELITDYCQKIKAAEEELMVKMRLISSLETQCQSQQKKHQKQKIEMECNHKSELESINNKMVEESEEHQEQLKIVEKQLKAQKQHYNHLEARHKMSIEEKFSLHSQKNQLTGKLEKINTFKKQVKEQIWRLRIENEQYQKKFQEISKENYLLKKKVPGNTQNSYDQLLNRAAFYKDRFDTIKVQLQQAFSTIRKQKEKGIKLQEQLSGIRENQKNTQMISKSDVNEEVQRQLIEENQQLKKKIEIMEQLNASKDDFMTAVELQKKKQLLDQREEELRMILIEELKVQDSTKENITTNKTTKQLLSEFKKIRERNRAQETRLREIKNEPKIKTHNYFLEMQNIYPKEQIRSFNGQSDHPPRKRVKLDEDSYDMHFNQ